MKRKFAIVLSMMIYFLCSLNNFAAGTNGVMNVIKKTHAPVHLNYAHHTLTIFNSSAKKSLNLKNARLEFYTSTNISRVQIGKDNRKVMMVDTSNQPNNAGNKHKVILDNLNIVLAPKQQIQITLPVDSESAHGFQIYIIDRVPVDVRVTTFNREWIQTISVCNISSSPIPLNDVELDFNFAGTMGGTSFWGDPWLDWKVASQAGQAVVLTGGSSYVQPLAPDPSCQRPLTIQYNSEPTRPAPSAPFVFKAAGGTPSGTGSLSLTVPNAPLPGLPNPVITVRGGTVNTTQTVPWGTRWVVPNLTPGSYNVSTPGVTNGQNYYYSAPRGYTILARTTTSGTLIYQNLPTAQVTVRLVNSPDPSEEIAFAGNKFTVTRTVANNGVITLPFDTFNVTATAPGYGINITPSPLIVSGAGTLTLNYQENQSSTMVGFFESWRESSPTDDANTTNLAHMPGYMNVINLAFMKPDAQYVRGSLHPDGTGFQFQYPSHTVLKFAVSYLHREHPGTKVLASVGGGTYNNWAAFNPLAIADFVMDYGLDGVDIDYQPTTPNCAANASGQVSCAIDSAFQGYIASLRALLPRPYVITVTSYGVAAYGEGQWRTALPASPYTGMMLPLLRSVTARDIDMINVMSYDVGTEFDAATALNAYSNYYSGPINMGVAVSPEVGGHVYKLCDVTTLTEAVKARAVQRNVLPGMMLWSVFKTPTGAATPVNPNAQMIATTLCHSLGRSECYQPLLQKAV